MSTIGTYGDANRAPEHHCSNFGTPSWSGKHTSEITLEMLHDMKAFIIRETARKANNDAVQGCIGENETPPFHPDFLKGKPYKYWKECYSRSIEKTK
ncbi:TPA: hypothetical protein ACPVZG_005312 [Vibrio parahaemolyticus]